MQVKVALEGFYDTATSEMSTTLASSATFPTSQPYSAAPFNYAGTESFTALPADAVDWLLLELREADNFEVVVARQAVLLRKDGFIMQTDGTSGVSFANVPSASYHLAIFHRNHLGVMSSLPVALDASNYVYDFTQADWKAYGNQQLKSVGNIYALFAGDMNGDNIINNQDYNYYKLNAGSNVGYAIADIDGDNDANTQDHDLWFGNRSKIGFFK